VRAARALVQRLEQGGVQVEVRWPPATSDGGTLERRDQSQWLVVATETATTQIVAQGAYDTIKAAVRWFREQFPRAEAVIEGDDDEPDDGGFLDSPSQVTG
jgi:hypothetical protein